MSLLAKVTKGGVKRPHFIGLYGPDGVGKTSFGAEAPKPIFLGTDDGLAAIDAEGFTPKNWEEAKAFISELLSTEHGYESLVIDTANGFEILLWNYIIKAEKVSSIEEVGGGFGKGYVLALEHWAALLNDLKRLRQKMNVIILGHAKIKTFEDPHQNEKFDRYMLKMHEGSASLIREAVDCFFFANFETQTRKEKGSKKAKAFGDGKRVMYTERRPAFDAKSRFDLPFEMELSWKAFVETVEKAKPASAATEDAILKLFKGKEDEAVTYLVHIEWLLPGQTLADLLAKRRRPILNRPDDFLRAVEEFKQQPPAEEQDEEPSIPESNE